jgi:AcrR family transcriptional regulator
MSAEPRQRDRRAERRQATRQEILAAAWALARERGLAQLTMRDLGERVGMRAQSLYVYFPAKHAMLDAMFAEGFGELLRRVTELQPPDDPAAALHRHASTFLRFATEDLARYHLLFQRVVPGFEPSVAAYEVSVRALSTTRSRLDACGITAPESLDVYTALLAGLAAQQMSNEPGGDRWTRLADRVVDMFLEQHTPTTEEEP